MSFQYAQYGDGFDVAQPTPQALRFEELLHLRGEPVNVVHRLLTGYDGYGQPVYTESSFTEQAIIKRSPDSQSIIPGSVPSSGVDALLRKWAPVQPEGCALEVQGDRYSVTGVEENPAYLHVKGRRSL